MKNMTASLTCLLCLAVVVIASLGCIQQGEKLGPLKNESKSLPIGDAKMVDAKITMGVGELMLSGGAQNLLDANFIYNLPSWKPEVTYSIDNGKGSLRVSQPSIRGSRSEDIQNEWILHLNNDIPLKLEVMLGAGESTLSLGGTSLTELDARTGAGDVKLDLSGDWKKSLKGSIQQGIGDLDLILPREVGASVNITQGIGSVETGNGIHKSGTSYFNDAYGKSPVNLDLVLKSGIGETHLSLPS